jgi:AcrR family transcriptional regulator
MSKRKTANGSGSLTAEDWVRAAARAIEEGGVTAVAVEPLARKLGVTKGSFYWHFKNRGALLEAVLERWEEECTEAVITAAEGISDPRERLVWVFDEATADEFLIGRHTSQPGIFFSSAFEQEISDAADDPVVGTFLRHVAERRVDYLEECYRALGCSTEEAHHRGLLAYAAYVGTMRLGREVPGRVPQGDGYRAYRRHLISTLVPPKESRPIVS